MRKYTQPILYTEGGEEPEGYLPVCNAFAEFTIWYDPEQELEDSVIDLFERYIEDEGDADWFWKEVHCI
jgi:hypothetical protein